MEQSQAARGADVQGAAYAAGTVSPSSRALGAPPDRPHRARLLPAPDRLIARIASGTATPDDLAGLPQGVLRYLDAVITLCDAGALDLDRETDGDVAVLTREHAWT